MDEFRSLGALEWIGMEAWVYGRGKVMASF